MVKAIDNFFISMHTTSAVAPLAFLDGKKILLVATISPLFSYCFAAIYFMGGGDAECYFENGKASHIH